jgi:hypothetical protein
MEIPGSSSSSIFFFRLILRGSEQRKATYELSLCSVFFLSQALMEASMLVAPKPSLLLSPARGGSSARWRIVVAAAAGRGKVG